MQASYFVTGRHISHRSLLREAGIALSLPFLESMLSAYAHAATTGVVAKPSPVRSRADSGYPKQPDQENRLFINVCWQPCLP